MAGGDHAPPHGQRAAKDPGDPQVLQAVRHSHHIHDGVQGPQFVEVDRFQGLAVNAGLNLPQETEGGKAPGLDRFGQTRRLDQGANLPVGAGRLGRPGLNLHLDAGEVLLGHPAGREGDPGQPQGREQPLQLFHRQPQINQGPQGHIAADAGKTIKKRPAWLNSQELFPLTLTLSHQGRGD